MTDKDHHKNNTTEQQPTQAGPGQARPDFNQIWQQIWAEKEQTAPDANIQDILDADLKPQLERLHRLWNLARDPSDHGGEPTLEKEKWFQLLTDLNRCWDIRSKVEQLDLKPDHKEEILEHYPGVLAHYLGLSPSPPDDTSPLATIRTVCEKQLATLHDSWNIDTDLEQEHPEGETVRHSFLGSGRAWVTGLVRRLVRVQTGPLFQRQRDFNARTVGLLEDMINSLTRYQQRSTRTTLELINRQYCFNVLLVQFINCVLQDMVFARQQQYNAELVQVIQKVLERFPELVLERSEILYSRLMADLEQLRVMVKPHSDQSDPDDRKVGHGD
ncbi:hypothetical protein JXQ70_08805 [bacterium]|nr:hypothetical protein [bacterium]